MSTDITYLDNLGTRGGLFYSPSTNSTSETTLMSTAMAFSGLSFTASSNVSAVGGSFSSALSVTGALSAQSSAIKVNSTALNLTPSSNLLVTISTASGGASIKVLCTDGSTVATISTSGSYTAAAGTVSVQTVTASSAANAVSFYASGVGGYRSPITSYTSGDNGSTVVAYGIINLSTLSTGSTMVLPTISTKSSDLGVPFTLVQSSGSTASWSFTCPANHTINSGGNHIALSSKPELTPFVTLIPVSSLMYAIAAYGQSTLAVVLSST